MEFGESKPTDANIHEVTPTYGIDDEEDRIAAEGEV
jgi:hypothetical protein